jgi:hypothetical protein
VVANTQYTTEGTIKTPNLLEETQEDLLSAGKSLITGNTAGMMSSLFGAAKGAFESNQAHEKTKKTKTSSADVVMWSGCKDSQTVGSFFLLFAFFLSSLFFLTCLLPTALTTLPIPPELLGSLPSRSLVLFLSASLTRRTSPEEANDRAPIPKKKGQQQEQCPTPSSLHSRRTRGRVTKVFSKLSERNSRVSPLPVCALGR